MKNIDAIIFDLDGTLVESQTSWRYAETKLFERCGHYFDFDIAIKYNGMNITDVARVVMRELKPKDLTLEEASVILRTHLMEAAKKGTTVKLAGADEIIAMVKPRYKLAIASGSPTEIIASILEGFGWSDAFPVKVSSEEVARGKPEPDVFLEAARRLGVEPGRILVIEDAAHGLTAARRAGMKCFSVGELDFDRKAEIADRAFKSVAEIELGHLEELS